MKKFLLIFTTLLLSACGNTNHISKEKISLKNTDLPAISTYAETGIFVSVSDPHIYSHKGPLAISGSYYFDPRFFYYPVWNLNKFKKAYSSKWVLSKVYYYDENGWAQAWLVVYVLRNYYWLKNVSLLENDWISKKIKFWQKIYPIPPYLNSKIFNVTWWYLWTWKYLIVYNPKLIKFKTGDLLLYSSDIWTMKEDNFYQNATWINIEEFDWSKLLTIYKGLKPKSEIDKLLKPLQLGKYKRVFIYYPKYRYRSAVLALYLQENYKK